MAMVSEEPRPVGAARTATALAQRTGWPVRTRDVPLLAQQGYLAVVGHYEGHPLYGRAQTAAVPPAAVAALVGARDQARAPGPAIEDFAGHLARLHGLEVSTTYRPQAGRWHLDWPVRPDGRPDPAGLRADLAAHPAAPYRRLVDLATPAHRAVAAARRALAPGAALVIDVETTGLGTGAVVVEVAVVEADTGHVLLNTLVCPGGVPVEPGAQRVHGITAAELAAAPTWPQVWPLLREIVGSRVLIAYNARFDERLIAQTNRHHGLAVPRGWSWACAMAWRGAVAHTSRPGALGGAHRALGDALAARAVVLAVAGADARASTAGRG